MHPYVYKKHHKPHQSIALVVFCIMILSQPVYSHSCNAAAKVIQIYSDLAKGNVHIEGNRVMASKCNQDCGYLYKVTIDLHYMLIYDIKSAKFICWNKSFKKLVAKRNPTNLTYCKFEDKVSLIRNSSHIRYTARDNKGKEVEMRFNKSGAFAKDRSIERCLKRHNVTREKIRFMVKLTPKMVEESPDAARGPYITLSNYCANPDFLVRDRSENCTSGLTAFCTRMKRLRDKGHSITLEIMDLCKKEWVKNY